MMNQLGLEKEKIIKNIRNLFRLKKEIMAIKGRIIKDIRNLFEQEKVGCYKPVRDGNFWSNNYIEYESDGDENKALSTEEYINKTETYFKNIINNIKNFDNGKSN